MAVEIPTLWPVNDIKVDVLTPLAILRVQANELSKITQGILKAEVLTTQGDEVTTHVLDIIAPSLNSRHRVLGVTHSNEMVYPVIVDAEIFQQMKATLGLMNPWGHEDEASSQQEFVNIVRKVLVSGPVLQPCNHSLHEAMNRHPITV